MVLPSSLPAMSPPWSRVPSRLGLTRRGGRPNPARLLADGRGKPRWHGVRHPRPLVILLVAGFVAFLVINAAEKGGPNAEGEGGPPGIGADDETPLGDTTQHAGEQTPEGTTPGGRTTAGSPAAGARTRPRPIPTRPRTSPAPARPRAPSALEFEGRQPRR